MGRLLVRVRNRHFLKRAPMTATILLVHGACHGAWCWDRLAPVLACSDRRVIAPDLPGRAGRGRAGWRFTLNDYAAAIVCGGMGRERNLLIDARLEDRTPQTHIRSPINAENVRRMTPIEWERLQGFPDGWTAGVADTHRYRLLGNSVTVPVVNAVASAVMKELKNPLPFVERNPNLFQLA